MTCRSGPGATHHLACDCREEALATRIARWKAEATAARDYIAKLEMELTSYRLAAVNDERYIYYAARAADKGE